MSKSQSFSKPLQSVLSKVDEASRGRDTDLKSVMEAFGDRAFGPVLVLCGIVLLTPIGAIPGMPFVIFVTLSTFAMQILTGRSHPWLPKCASRVTLKQTHLSKTKDVVRPWLEKIDGLLRPRWPWAVTPPLRKYAAFLTLALAAGVLILGAVPFAAMLPGAIIIVLGLGITARDGLFVSLGLITGTMSLLLLLSLFL